MKRNGFRRFWGPPPPNNQQFVGCQPTAEVWWLELHYSNRQLQSVTSSTSIPASFRSRFGVIFFLFPPIPSLCFAVAFTTRLGAWPHPEYQPGGVRACFRHLVWGRRGAGRSAFGPLSCCSAPPSVPAGVATHAHPSFHTNTPLASFTHLFSESHRQPTGCRVFIIKHYPTFSWFFPLSISVFHAPANGGVFGSRQQTPRVCFAGKNPPL